MAVERERERYHLTDRKSNKKVNRNKDNKDRIFERIACPFVVFRKEIYDTG